MNLFLNVIGSDEILCWCEDAEQSVCVCVCAGDGGCIFHPYPCYLHYAPGGSDDTGLKSPRRFNQPELNADDDKSWSVKAAGLAGKPRCPPGNQGNALALMLVCEAAFEEQTEGRCSPALMSSSGREKKTLSGYLFLHLTNRDV